MTVTHITQNRYSGVCCATRIVESALDFTLYTTVLAITSMQGSTDEGHTGFKAEADLTTQGQPFNLLDKPFSTATIVSLLNCSSSPYKAGYL